MQKWLTRILWLFAIGGFAIIGVILYVQSRYAGRIVTESNAHAPYAIILGASVTTKGEASDALRDRVQTAVDLYKQGKVQKLLMSGDDGAFHVDEVGAMAKIALSEGVTSSDILVDGHGYRTYESCKRAVQVFEIKEAIIVTQRFHLGRALYLCSVFGMNAKGVSADREPYQRIVYFVLRDLLASAKAWWDVNIVSPRSPVAYPNIGASTL
ncbi:MAG TPA: ElyC/SanA/YdcF family protein [Patescibacteria group bacterium]|nr:ElyC/SanA/YdcF family protein [Patescibacteria group bacterium]